MATWPYSWPWPEIRKQVLERDNHTCQIRGPKCTTTATDADHIIPWLEGGAPYDPTNLRASCPPCNRGRASTRTAAMNHLNRQPQQAGSRDW